MSQDNSHDQNIEGLAHIFKNSPDLLKALLDSMSSQSRMAIISPALRLTAKYFATGKAIYDKKSLSHPEFQKAILARPEFLEFIQKNPLTILNAVAASYNNQWIFTKGSILDADVRKDLAKVISNDKNIQTISAITQNTIDMINSTDNDIYYSYLTNIIHNFIKIPQVNDILQTYNKHMGDYVYNIYSHYESNIAVTELLKQTTPAVPNNTIDNIIQLLNQNDFDKKLSSHKMQQEIAEILQPRYSVLKAVGLSKHTDETIDIASTIIRTYQTHMSKQSDKATILKGLTSTLFLDLQNITDSKVLEGINTYFAKNDSKPLAISILDSLNKSDTLRVYLKESTPSIKSIISLAIEQTQGQGAYGMSASQLASINNVVTAIIPVLLDTPKSLSAVLLPALNSNYEEMGLELFSLLSKNSALRESLKGQSEQIKFLLELTLHNPTISDQLRSSYNISPEEVTKAFDILPILLDKHPENLHTTLTKLRAGDYFGMAQEILKIPENPEVIKYLQDNHELFANAIIKQLPIKSDRITSLTASFTKMLPDLVKEPKYLQDILSTLTTSPKNVLGLYDKLLTVAKSQPTLKDSISKFTDDLIKSAPDIVQHDQIASKLQTLHPALDPKTILSQPIMDLIIEMKHHLGEREITSMMDAYSRSNYLALATPILKALKQPEVQKLVQHHSAAFEQIINHTTNIVAPRVGNFINVGKYSQIVLNNPSALLYLVNTAHSGTGMWNSIPSASNVATTITSTPSIIRNAMTGANNRFWGLLGYDTPKTSDTAISSNLDSIDPTILKATQTIAPNVNPADNKLIAMQLMEALTACKDDEIKISEILTPDTIESLARTYRENKDSFSTQAASIIVPKYYQLLDAKDVFYDTVEEQTPSLLQTPPTTLPSEVAPLKEPEDIFHDALEEQTIIPAASQEQVEQQLPSPPKSREWKDYPIIGSIINAWGKIKEIASRLLIAKEKPTQKQEYQVVDTKSSTEPAKIAITPLAQLPQLERTGAKWQDQERTRGERHNRSHGR